MTIGLATCLSLADGGILDTVETCGEDAQQVLHHPAVVGLGHQVEHPATRRG